MRPILFASDSRPPGTGCTWSWSQLPERQREKPPSLAAAIGHHDKALRHLLLASAGPVYPAALHATGAAEHHSFLPSREEFSWAFSKRLVARSIWITVSRLATGVAVAMQADKG